MGGPELAIHTYAADGGEAKRAALKFKTDETIRQDLHQVRSILVGKPMFEVGDTGATAAELETSDGDSPLAFLGPGLRPRGVTVIAAALPLAFAQHILGVLRALPASAWEVLETDANMLEMLELSQAPFPQLDRPYPPYPRTLRP